MGQDLADYFRRPPALGDITMNFETIDNTTIVVPCTIDGDYRVTLPTADLLNGNFDSLSDEDFHAIMGLGSPAEAAARSQLMLPIADETPEDLAIAAFMDE